MRILSAQDQVITNWSLTKTGNWVSNDQTNEVMEQFSEQSSGGKEPELLKERA